MALNKLEIPTTDPETNSRSPNLGTRWVAPGEGSTWAELIKAFGSQSKTVRAALRKDWRNCNYSLDRHTNLRLTGAPLTQTDRERWESGNVE